MPQTLTDTYDGWAEAAALLERLEQSARAAADSASFFRDAVEGVRASLELRGCVIRVGEHGTWRSLASTGQCESSGSTSLRQQTAEESAGASAGADTRDSDQTPQETGSADSLATLTVRRSLGTGVVIEIACVPAAADPGDQRDAIENFLESILDLCGYRYLTDRLRDSLPRDQQTSAALPFLERLASAVDRAAAMHAVCRVISDQLGADRVTLFEIRNGRVVARASSAHGSVQRRSSQIRKLELLAGAVTAEGADIVFTVGQPCDVNGELDQDVVEYMDASGCRELVLVPVAGGQDSVAGAALAIESFRLDERKTHDSMPERVERCKPLLAQASLIALRQTSLPRWRPPRLRDLTPLRRWGLLGFACLAASLLLIPVPLTIEAEGMIQPTGRHRLFAPVGGRVVDLPATDGDSVSSGSLLAKMHSPELQLQQETVAGDLSVAQAELNSLRAAKTGSDRRNRGIDAASQSSGNELVLKRKIASLQAQLDLLMDVQHSLSVRSPVDGRVVRWDRNNELLGRELPQGQLLMEVVQDGGEYCANLDLLDRDYFVVAKAMAESAGVIECDLHLRSNPQSRFHGRIVDVADTVHFNERGQRVVQVSVAVESAALSDLPIGATTLARLRCGKAPLGMVLLRPTIQWVKTLVW